MNEKKIAFISCVNDRKAYEECLFYIDKLHIPDGYEIETIAIEDATSITSGYNKGMNASDAKYKVYLHQDLLIINKNFIEEFIKIFIEDKNIGIIGVAGSRNLPVNGIWWDDSELLGTLYEYSDKIKKIDFNNTNDMAEAMTIDGCIIITQYDERWNEEIFDGWHFYDISQCMEFRKKGYKTCIPKQNEIWCLHNCGIIEMDYYEKYRLEFLECYKELLM